MEGTNFHFDVDEMEEESGNWLENSYSNNKDGTCNHLGVMGKWQLRCA